jgi:FixJ family two-component response regulator
MSTAIQTGHVRLHIVEDQKDTRDAIAAVLRLLPVEVVCHENAELFLQAYDPTAAELLVLDLTLPGMDGFRLLEQLMARCEFLPTLVMSGDAAVERVVLAMRRGAVGFLAKPPQPQQLLDQVERMVPQAASFAAERVELRRLQELRRKLTERETEVFAFVARGMTAKQIAHELELSLRTAHIHRTNVLRKFGVESAVDLAAMARRLEAAAQAASGQAAPARICICG